MNINNTKSTIVMIMMMMMIMIVGLKQDHSSRITIHGKLRDERAQRLRGRSQVSNMY